MSDVKDNLLTPENEAKGETPEKFIDPATGEVRVEAMIASYKELERKLSTMMPKPEGPEGKQCVQRMLGCPECAEDYDIRIDHELFTADPEVNRRLHAQGLTNEQVQEVYNLAAERLVPMIFELAQDYQADREVERLIAAFGGAERWAEVSRQLLAYGKKNLPPDVLGSLSSSFEGVMALFRMMKGQGDEPALTGADDMRAAAGDDETSLRGMMRDPRYWRERDPSYVAQVTQGFQRMYGEK
ncbi:MAG: hypothetical protein KKA05_07155 [Alphaproteobacteria bacterium]|nr:hypothetical protein [Alphaproteobacteria bacterium]